MRLISSFIRIHRRVRDTSFVGRSSWPILNARFSYLNIIAITIIGNIMATISFLSLFVLILVSERFPAKFVHKANQDEKYSTANWRYHSTNCICLVVFPIGNLRRWYVFSHPFVVSNAVPIHLFSTKVEGWYAMIRIYYAV